jgi:predicted nucleotidyltransferase
MRCLPGTIGSGVTKRQATYDAPVTQSATSLADARRFAEEIAAWFAEQLGDSLKAVILHGSVATGQYIPDKSDLDLLVIADALDDAARLALTGFAQGITSQWSGKIDLRVVRTVVAKTPSRAPALEAFVEIGWAPTRCAVTFDIAVEPDLIVEFFVCREDGISLHGPPAAQVIGEVPRDWVLEEADAALARWQAIGDDPAEAEFTVLTACRIWRFAMDGRRVSKQEAGEWALSMDPSLQVVAESLHQRLEDSEAPIDPTGVAELLARVRSEIA